MSTVFVDNISNQAGTSAMTIDTNGVVTTPARPAFSAYRDSSTVEALTGTLVFNGTRSNVGNHYNTSTGKFTAPIAGLYQFNFAGFGVNSAATVIAANSSVYVTLINETTSTDLARSYVLSVSTASYPNVSFASMVSLAANDVVRLDVGGQYVYSDATDVYLTFSGYLVG